MAKRLSGGIGGVGPYSLCSVGNEVVWWEVDGTPITAAPIRAAAAVTARRSVFKFTAKLTARLLRIFGMQSMCRQFDAADSNTVRPLSVR